MDVPRSTVVLGVLMSGRSSATPRTATSERADNPRSFGCSVLDIDGPLGSRLGGVTGAARERACRPRTGRGTSELVGRVDDRALAGVVDERVLDVERVRRDDALDEVLLAGTVQRQAETAAVRLAALGDEGLELVVDVVLTREGRAARGGEAARCEAVQRAGAVEVDRGLEPLAQRAGGLEDGDEADRRLVRDAVDQREVGLAVLGLQVGEHLRPAVDARALGQRGVRDLLEALLLDVGELGARHALLLADAGWCGGVRGGDPRRLGTCPLAGRIRGKRSPRRPLLRDRSTRFLA